MSVKRVQHKKTDMSEVRKSKTSNICVQKVEIIPPPLLIKSSAPKRLKLVETLPSGLSKMPAVVLNGSINLTRTKTSQISSNFGSNIYSIKEDFFLKNENNCFYKCVLCSETVQSKPSYKSHMQMVHETEMNKYFIQKGFVDATKEFCTELVQTDFNIVQSLTSIFDQIDNIEKIVRDHQKRLRLNNKGDVELTQIKDEEFVLKLYGEMIQRAFDIVSEKNEMIACLQEDVAELLEQNADWIDNQTESVIVKEEDEQSYELFYVEEDINQEDGTGKSDTPDGNELTTNTASTSSKRGRPKGDQARSLNDCLADIPEPTADYIRTLTANGDSKYQCNKCDVAAKSKMLLCVHYMRVHLKIKNKICPHCNRPFASQGDLTRHIRIHSGENPFKCDYTDCTSEFKTSGDLKKHKMVHERDPSHRPFECECGSKFARQTDYTRHKKIHLIGKVENVGFPCELCSKVFYRKDLFRTHWNHHLKIKPYECETCLKRFAKKYDLLKHVEKQHASVECDECCGRFDSRSKLIQHFGNGMCKAAKYIWKRSTK